ncbi:hypothetical protein EG328_007794 [Venturia inaequalis]|uniref:Uncharacterized protein n=1 Tax=Venturia inaequalis TaxID=5025 RepID=A0A8H3UEK3_VENIN|nr:hypothetical protein EG328_007794 [Venturia inaequalis]
MATGHPDSSKAWTTASNNTFPSSQGTLASQLPSLANPSWSTVRTLPPLRRFSEAQIHSPWSSRAYQFPPPVALPLPLDTRPAARNQTLLFQEQSPFKRRRIERFGEAQHPKSPPEPDAESPPALHARYGQSASSVPFNRQWSQPSDAVEDPRPPSTHQDLVWGSHAESKGRDVGCCQPGCKGQSCIKLRSMLQDLISEITKDPLDPSAPAIGHQPPKPISHDSLEIGSPEALEWAIQRLRWNNASLKTLVSIQASGLPEPPPLFRRTPTPPFESPTFGMKRQNDGSEKPIEFSSRRSLQRSGGPSSLTSSQPDDNWRALEAMDPPSHPSHQHRRLSSFSFVPPSGSPSQASQAARTLPSPSSLNPHSPSNSGSVPASGPSSAQTAHLQDLQHQVSVKTLALQTLQKEYDSLLQKLERQRVRSGALEKKFEVSDAEINSLTDEREKLTDQVQFLEQNVEELQKTRDETRRMGTESASQYMKIVEMADRLQSRSVEDKKAWNKERQLLLSRLQAFEQGLAESVEGREDFTAKRGFLEDENLAAIPENGSSILQWEVHQLKERISNLESSLHKAKRESHAIREAALTLAGCGQRIDAAIDAGLAKQEQRR